MSREHLYVRWKQAMTLHLVYRMYGGENIKGRPAFYSKKTSLASFLQASEVAGAEAVVFADGAIPDALRNMAAARCRVVDLPGGPVGMRTSYWTALRFPDREGWADDDLVYFCEDDYLHDSQAFAALEAAADAIPSAGYVALYASTPRHPIAPGVHHTVPADWVERPYVEVDGHRWVNVPSTASTFGARVGTLRADLGIFRLAYEFRALTRRRHPHLLYAADPNFACHLETEFMAPGVDWVRHTRSAADWAGYPLDANGAPAL